jgi:hypothetical protein
MEWIIGVYLVIGVFKTIGKFSDPNPAVKPLWMSTESDGFKMAVIFTIYSLFWPFTR